MRTTSYLPPYLEEPAETDKVCFLLSHDFTDPKERVVHAGLLEGIFDTISNEITEWQGSFVDSEGIFYEASGFLDGGLKVEIEYFLKGYSIDQFIEQEVQELKEKMSQPPQPESSNIRIKFDLVKANRKEVYCER